MSRSKFKCIGIVAVSGPGAALCWQTIYSDGEKFTGVRYLHPEVIMHGLPFSEYMVRIERGDWKGVTELMIASARLLAAAGADFLICPDNTVHVVFDEVAERSPIPWLHIAEEVAKEAVRLNYRKLLVLGTKYLMESDVYTSRLKAYGLGWTIPSAEEREVVNKIIFNELVYGVVTPESRMRLVEIIRDTAASEGCDAVVLGCTELPLILNDEVSPIPALDSTRILARAAIKKAIGCNCT